jgi:hypothetical protein
MSIVKTGNYRFSELADITISPCEMVTFTVWSERENQTQPFQLPSFIDLYTFMRAAYGLDKTIYRFTPTPDKSVIIRSGSQKYILAYA